MNRTTLAKKIALKLYLRQSFAKTIIDQICVEISKSLSKKDRVYLQKLGAFHAIKRKSRKRYNPRTGKVEINPARADVVFRPSKQLLHKLVKK